MLFNLALVDTFEICPQILSCPQVSRAMSRMKIYLTDGAQIDHWTVLML